MNSKKVFNIIKKISSFFISLSICFSITLISLLIVFNNTVFNVNFVKDCIKSSNYVEKIKDDLYNKFISFGKASGFSSEFFGKVISDSELEQDIIKSVESLYDGVGQYKSDAFEENLYNKLVEDGIARGYDVTGKIESNLIYLASVCSDVYNDAISIPFYVQISSLLKNSSKICSWLILTVGSFTVIMAFILLIMNFSYIHRFVRYCIYSVSGCCLMFTISLLWICISKVIDRVAVLNALYKNFFDSFLNGILSGVFMILIIMILILFILIILYHKLFNPLKSKSKY